jgi:hypothetical protein
MNVDVEIGIEAAQLPEQEYMNGIFVAVQAVIILPHPQSFISCCELGECSCALIAQCLMYASSMYIVQLKIYLPVSE